MSKLWKLLVEKKLLLLVIIAVALILILLPIGTIAVIRIDGPILYHEDAVAVTRALDRIQGDIFVKAVVLDIDSPGGTSEATEEIYYRMRALEDRMPVVASIDSVGASGGYYIAAPSEHIFAKPSSEVGGIGVIVELPEVVERPDLVASGPFKLRWTKESVLKIVDPLKKSFIDVVRTHREDKLRIDPIELSSGEVYIGIKGREIGLIDELGGLNDAISKAAQLAGLVNYRVVYVSPLSYRQGISLFVNPSELQSNSTTVPRFYHLYLNLGEGE